MEPDCKIRLSTNFNFLNAEKFHLSRVLCFSIAIGLHPLWLNPVRLFFQFFNYHISSYESYVI